MFRSKTSLFLMNNSQPKDTRNPIIINKSAIDLRRDSIARMSNIDALVQINSTTSTSKL